MQLLKHDAFRWNNIPKIGLFYLKLILQEPFRWQEKRKYNDIICAHTLPQDPIFVIGHWRSGTSFMQYLLGRDPRLGYLNKFEAVFPDLFLHSERRLKAWVRRIPRTFNLTKDAENMSIDLHWDSPSEVEIALTTMISRASLHWGHIFPQEGREYFNKYLFFEGASAAEINRWEKDYTYLIKKISLKNDVEHVLVKSPGNTSRIKKLLQLYPSARFIFIHRNPYDIFYSSQKLWHTLLDNLALQYFSQEQMEQEIVWIYKTLMSQYLEQRSLIPNGNLVEVRFSEFITSPLVQLSAIYDQFNLDEFVQVKPFFRSFLAQKSTKKISSYEYEDRIVKWLNQEWEFAFREWGYFKEKNLALTI